MIETEQSVLVGASIDRVWEHARDIQGWASIMPGYQSCEIINDDDSRWVLKVGMGGLVRTVNVLVHVDKWDGPGRVDFTYKLEGDPVSGGGTYLAAPAGPAQTEMKLQVKVIGSGPVAPMWEAMGAPLLPAFAKGFAEQLKEKIESAIGIAPPAAAPGNAFDAVAAWWRNFWRMLAGEPKEENP